MGIFKHNEKEALIRELKAIIEEYKDNKDVFISSSRSLYKKRKKYLLTILKFKALLSTIKNLPKWCNEDYTAAICLLDNFIEATQYENSPLDYVDLKDKSGRTSMMIKDAMESSTEDLSFWTTSDAIAVGTVIGTLTYGSTASVTVGDSATTSALSWLSSNDSFTNTLENSLGKLGLFLTAISLGPIGWIGSLATYAGYSRYKNEISISEIKEHMQRITDELDLLENRINNLKTLINRTNNYANKNLLPSVEWLTTVLPKDYKEWDDDQKHKLEQTINHISNMANLINERI